MIETLDDVVEQIADWLGIYGSHGERSEECQIPSRSCRSCFASHLTARIEQAVEIDRKLRTPEVPHA